VPPLGVAKDVRAISSGGERFLDAEEVSGSNPLSPTSEFLLDTRKAPRKGKPLDLSGGFTTYPNPPPWGSWTWGYYKVR
jgi:hypothetical protein